MLPQVFVLDPVAGGQSVQDLPPGQLAVEVFSERSALIARVRRQAPDLVMLHHRPGDRSVLETMRHLHAVSPVPCMLRPVRGDDPVLRTLALEAGADDCIPYAASPREALARIRAVLRRTAPRPVPVAHGWQLSCERRDLFTPRGEACHLTAAEFEMLLALTQANRPLSREELCQRIFRRPHSPEDRAVDNLVARLRRKLESNQAAGALKAVRGVGYAFAGFHALA